MFLFCNCKNSTALFGGASPASYFHSRFASRHPELNDCLMFVFKLWFYLFLWTNLFTCLSNASVVACWRPKLNRTLLFIWMHNTQAPRSCKYAKTDFSPNIVQTYHPYYFPVMIIIQCDVCCVDLRKKLHGMFVYWYQIILKYKM